MADRNKTTSDKNNAVKQLRFGPYAGIYLGQIVDTEDFDRAGRVRVKIPALSGDISKTDGVITCQWSSPFAGSTPAESLGNDIKSPYDTQKSYGMWMIPPDIGNEVLVCFADGNLKHGTILSCLFQHKLTHMVPGMPSGLNHSDPGLPLPVNEKHRRDGILTHNDAVRPIALDLSESVVKQGLANDVLRGAGTSGSRRESPSKVFGFLTPGPKDPNRLTHRLGGHQFVMDDDIDNRLIRIRSAGGNQILLDDNSGSIYVINKSGSAWFEMSDSGVKVFSEAPITMRTKGNFNIRADKDVNIEAGHNINMRAAGDNIAGIHMAKVPLGVPPLGPGGNINIEAARDLNQTASLNFKSSAIGGDVDITSVAGGTWLSGTLSVDIFTGGKLATSSGIGTSIQTSGAFAVTSAGAAITSPTILLNSGGPQAAPASPAFVTLPLVTPIKVDAPLLPPIFDKAAGSKGTPSAPSLGLRVGPQAIIASIVTTLLTNEPYAGHDSFDIMSASELSEISSNPDLVLAVPEGGIAGLPTPADVNLPTGSLIGESFVSPDGLPILDGDVLGGVAKYVPNEGAINNFKDAVDHALTSIPALAGVVDTVQAVSDFIKTPTLNKLGDSVIGLGHKLSAEQLSANAIGFDSLGESISLSDPKITKLTSSVTEALGGAVSPSQVEAGINALASKNIAVIPDGDGLIYQDGNTNTRLVDIKKGIGPIASTMGFVGELTTSWKNVSPAITQPVSENQAVSLAHFAQSVGEESFLSSNVLDSVNKGDYNEVPRMMSSWVQGARPGSNQIIQQPSLTDLRAFQISVFETPDSTPIELSENYTPGEASFTEQARILDNIRKSGD